MSLFCNRDKPRSSWQVFGAAEVSNVPSPVYPYQVQGLRWNQRMTPKLMFMSFHRAASQDREKKWKEMKRKANVCLKPPHWKHSSTEDFLPVIWSVSIWNLRRRAIPRDICTCSYSYLVCVWEQRQLVRSEFAGHPLIKGSLPWR